MNSLQTRILSALVMLPAFVGALFFSPPIFMLLILVMALIAVKEWLAMVMRKRDNLSSILIVLGPIYIGLATATLLWLYGHEVGGIYLTLLVCAMVWATDIFAYFSGKTIGGPKMAPKISPNKTWAGLFGGMAGSAVVAILFGLPQFSIGIFDSVPLYCMAFMGALLAGVGQIGDLMVSALKRHYDVKDTGNIIPGHGGILDRIDGLLLVSLVFTVIVMVLESYNG